MYSNIRSVQILVALLKEYRIREIVLSPGGSDIPLIHSIETDSFFNCYSVVDERSAAYFAMGLAQEKNAPAACICTSGTAVCNYVPAITEAFYQSVPVVAITADKNPYYQDQLEIQKIDQNKMFSGVVKKSVELPVIKNAEDEWTCNRLVNEALLELDHHGKGPVQINIPIVGNTSVYDCDKLPVERKINIEMPQSRSMNWKQYINQLEKYKRIMIVVGQNCYFDDEDVRNMELFFDRFNCIFSIEHLSNIICKGCVNTYPVTETGGVSAIECLTPDLVISLGNNLAAYNLKPLLRNHYKDNENWLINENGIVRDAYKSLTTIFECTPKMFFKGIIDYSTDRAKNDLNYWNLWNKELGAVKLPEFDFSNFMVANKLAQIIPNNSILHTAILNSTRLMQFFKLNEGITQYSNVGALGIDGCMSAFMGQSAASPQKLSFLLIGDLSFFYDMNAAGLRSINPNVRIVLLNNTGGSEFHYFMGKKNIPSINDYICAEHHKIAKGWIESLGYKYYSATNEKELNEALTNFAKPSEIPLFMEVFTDMEDDADRTKKIYYDAKTNIESQNSLKGFAKGIVKKVLIK